MPSQTIPTPTASPLPTIWGLTPAQLHDHYWASRGVQVVRAGVRSETVRKAELFLLIDPDKLVLFRLRALLDILNWTKPDLLLLRLHTQRDLGYRERVQVDPAGWFLRFERSYQAHEMLTTRVGLTDDRELAETWEAAESASQGWRKLRRAIPPTYRETRRVTGRQYERTTPSEVATFMHDLIALWPHPDMIVARVRKTASSAWADTDAKVEHGARFIGPVWVGAGRSIDASQVVVGPTALWDDPAKRPAPTFIQMEDIEPRNSNPASARPRKLSSWHRRSKRLFDIAFALLALTFTLPLYPFIILAIVLEDGWPIFFAHRRETGGNREFGCIKFRSMRKDADQIKARLAAKNQADGPQFFMENDPRLTRVGRFIRKTNLDELPQFINVLLGHMAIVGPRPSPRSENQYCPGWREARLSVRPGITGLWQVRRTRLRGQDFQEWIKYDIQYVETMSWRLDLWIIWRTVLVLVRGVTRS